MSGFTFVEMIVVVSIILVLFASAAVGFTQKSYSARQYAAVSEFVFNLRKIQNYCLIGKKTSGEHVSQSFGLHFVTNSQYIIFQDENGDNLYSPVSDIIMDTVDLPPGIQAANVDNSIICYVPQGSFCFDQDNLAGESSCQGNITFIFNIINSGINKTVYVNNASGQISYEK